MYFCVLAITMHYTLFTITNLILTIWESNNFSKWIRINLSATAWNTDQTIIAFLIALIIILIFVYSVCIEKRKRKSRKREKELISETDNLQFQIKEKIAENLSKEKQIKELKDELSKTKVERNVPKLSYEERIALLRQDKTYQLLNEKVSSGYIKSGQDYPKLQLTDTQKVKVFKAVDNAFHGFSTEIIKQYPRLTTQDVFYCCLYIMGLNEKQAAAITGKTYQAVWARSAKMNEIFGSNADLKNILSNFLKKWN